MKKAILDGAVLAGDRTNAHVHLQRELDLPDYYGCNLDALFDCLCEMNGVQIILTYVTEMKSNLRRYADNIVNVFEAAEEKKPVPKRTNAFYPKLMIGILINKFEDKEEEK